MNDRPDSLLPQRVLLATDLSARHDRPLDRATQLAHEWLAELMVVTAREGPATPEEVSSWLGGGNSVHAFELAARAELAREFAASGLTPSLRVVEADVIDGILSVAATVPDSVVVIGASPDQSFQQFVLGAKAVRLAQGLIKGVGQPLLVVRQRTRASYSRILVANDFSDGARRALETAVRLFPGRPITLFHALEDSVPALADGDAALVQAALERSAQWITRCELPADIVPRITVVIGHGAVHDAVADYAARQAVELVVLSVRHHSAMARVFIGSRSDDLLLHLACDTLLVPAGDGHDLD